MNIEKGQRVVAVCEITEGGGEGDPESVFPELTYIHAREGDPGVVESISDDGYPTVRFQYTGTATIVDENEIRVIPS